MFTIFHFRPKMIYFKTFIHKIKQNLIFRYVFLVYTYHKWAYPKAVERTSEHSVGRLKRGRHATLYILLKNEARQSLGPCKNKPYINGKYNKCKEDQ